MKTFAVPLSALSVIAPAACGAYDDIREPEPDATAPDGCNIAGSSDKTAIERVAESRLSGLGY